MIFQTRRLKIVKSTPQDVEHFLAIWNNPTIMKNVGFPRGLLISREKIVEQLTNQGDSEFDTRLIVVIKDTNERIGECKLGTPDDDGVSETDVKLLPEFWGQGFGSEVKNGLIKYLFEHTGCQAVKATPNVKNIASIKMQEAVGGIKVGETVWDPPADKKDVMTAVHSYIYLVKRDSWINLDS